MKFVIGIVFGILIAAQTPLAWDAYQKAQQCDTSLAKQVSDTFAKAHPDLDVVDCSFTHFYKAALQQALELH